ncbi:MAG TPA: TrmH family RNA methyltransferase [Candidatus Saccharimonadales bacterium]|nr:TrmH family RNA methyltransferase [Candidatus Saccharimonadales bacterium]
MNRQIVLIVHNLRSCHNVGAIFRTADGLGINHLYLTGYTPYPISKTDQRLPHLRHQINQKIHKTALGAENTIKWSHIEIIDTVIDKLRRQNFAIISLEQAKKSTNLVTYQPPNKIAVIIGREIGGIEPTILEQTDVTLEIPMFGQKESFNVVEAATMALYHFRFYTQN